MPGFLLIVSSVTFALLAFVVWRTMCVIRRRARGTIDAQREELLRGMSLLIDASRVSSVAVLEALDGAIHRHEPKIDAVLAFVPSGDELACVYVSGERVVHYATLRLRRDAAEHLPARAALLGHRLSASDGLMSPTDRRAIAVPMFERGGLRAVVYVSSSAGGAIAEDAIVRTISHAVTPYAIALEREADRADATYDGLTGLLTPRAFRERLSRIVDRARLRGEGVFTLWFIDTDCFKDVNDTHGHAAGDAVLQAMAGLIRSHTVPEIDLVARNGGDEFCALVFDAQKTLAIERAQVLCEAVRAYRFGVPMRITASIGVATYPYDARSASELLEVADAAMYHSKRSGRNRVSFAVNGTSFSIYT